MGTIFDKMTIILVKRNGGQEDEDPVLVWGQDAFSSGYYGKSKIGSIKKVPMIYWGGQGHHGFAILDVYILWRR